MVFYPNDRTGANTGSYYTVEQYTPTSIKLDTTKTRTIYKPTDTLDLSSLKAVLYNNNDQSDKNAKAVSYVDFNTNNVTLQYAKGSESAYSDLTMPLTLEKGTYNIKAVWETKESLPMVIYVGTIHKVDITTPVNGVIAIDETQMSKDAGKYFVSDGKVEALDGITLHFTIKPNAGYTLESLSIDGKDVGTWTEYTIDNISKDHTMSATFKSSYSGGIYYPDNNKPEPPKVINEDKNGSYEFTDNNTTINIKPNPGYVIDEVILNGESKGDVDQIKDLTSKDNIIISFKLSNKSIIGGVEDIRIIKLKAVASKGKVKLTWDKTKGYKLDGYIVYRATGTKAYKKMITKPAKYYINSKNLKKGTTYKYKVVGYRMVDGKTIYTKSATVKVKAK